MIAERSLQAAETASVFGVEIEGGRVVMKFDVLSEHRAGLGESPFWSAREQALYYVDVLDGIACRWSAADGVTTTKIAERLPFILPTAHGEILFGLRHMADDSFDDVVPGFERVTLKVF